MTGRLTYASRRRVLALSWGAGRKPAARAMVPDMPPVDTVERARSGGKALAESRTPAERRESASNAAKASHGPLPALRRFRAAWERATDEERAELLGQIRRELRDMGVIR